MKKKTDRNRLFLNQFLLYIATLGPIGYIPVMPGTFGAFAAMILMYIIEPGNYLQIVFILALLVLGIVSSASAEITLREKDSGKIVVDEFVGYFVAFLGLPQSMSFYFAAFLMFRFFDILKPYPIKKTEKIFFGGLAIMLDDILAGIYANIIIRSWIIIFAS